MLNPGIIAGANFNNLTKGKIMPRKALTDKEKVLLHDQLVRALEMAESALLHANTKTGFSYENTQEIINSVLQKVTA